MRYTILNLRLTSFLLVLALLPQLIIAQDVKEGYKNSERAKLLLAETNPTVIHISVDGLRGDAVSILGSDNLPNLHRLIFEGTSTLNARTDLDYTITLPNHSSQLTARGVLGPQGHNWTSNSDPSSSQTLHNNPNFQEVYCGSVFDQTHNYGLRTGLYASKSKFSIFEQSYNSVGGEADTVGVDHGNDKVDVYLYNPDISGLTSQLIADMSADRFDYAFIHLRDPDSQGHSTGWDVNNNSQYLESIERVDTEIGRIIDMIEGDQILRENAIVILTADHGGGDPYTSHGVSSSLINYRIPFAVWGKRIPVGKDLYSVTDIGRVDPGLSRPDYSNPDQPVRNGDAANLALRLLGLPAIPGSTIGFDNPLNIGTSPFPRLEVPMDQITFIDSTATISMFAYNPSDSTLSYSAIGLPPGLTMDELTGVISGAPNDYGSYEVYLEVSDGANSSAVLMTWVVLDPPVDQLCPADLMSLNWTFDPGEDLSLSYDDLSETLTIEGLDRTTNEANLEFSDIGFMPVVGQSYSINTLLDSYEEERDHTLAMFVIGNFNVRRLLFDFDSLPTGSPMNVSYIAQEGDSKFQILSGGRRNSLATAVMSDLTLDGCQVDPPIPEFVSFDKPVKQRSYRNQDVSLQLSASSPLGNPIVYAAIQLPPGLSLDTQTGLITGRINPTGIHDVVISVSDGSSMVTKAFEWQVGSLAEIKVFLQGPHSGSEMTALIDRDDIPRKQPYGGPILGFYGKEEILSSPDQDMVDWVTVELRKNTSGRNILVDVAAGILMKDGMVRGPNGEAGVVFFSAEPFVYYHFAIKHRNHLAVITQVPKVLRGFPDLGTLVDFTTGEEIFGTEPQFQNADGSYAMWQGDSSGDGIVSYSGTNNDRVSILNSLAGPSPFDFVDGYLAGDINLDGRVSYAGSGNDRVLILDVIDGPSAFFTRTTQVPEIIN